MKRLWLGLAALVLLFAALALLAARFDRAPAVPGAWLASQGLEPGFATVEGHRLRYVRLGLARDTVVLVHGFGSSLYTWKDVLPALSAHHDVIALDLPGFGESDLPADLSFEELPAAILGLMDRLGVERAALVGNSMGGAVAAAVAAEHPDRVSALALIDAAGFNLEPGAGPPLLRLVTSPVAALLEPLPGKRLIVEKALREVFHDERHVTDERLAEYLSGALRPGGLAARRSLLMSLQGRAAVVQEGLPRIEAPTLIVWGREDRWIPVAHAKLFADAIPGARTVVLEACGHVPQEERPEELGGLVAAFLAGLEDRAAPGGPTDARE